MTFRSLLEAEGAPTDIGLLRFSLVRRFCRRAIILLFIANGTWTVESGLTSIETELASINTLDNLATMQLIERAAVEYKSRIEKLCATTAPILSHPQRRAFLQSQKSWEAYRADQIILLDKIHAEMSGTMWIPIHAFATMDITRQRALELEKILEIVRGGR